MVYAQDEKRRLDNILDSFRDYIQEHPSFDIVYSEKIGYLRVVVEEPDGEGVVVIRSVDKLLDVLFNEIINDVRFDCGETQHYYSALDDDEAEEARNRITKILQKLDEEAPYCLDFLDAYLEDYPDNDIKE